METYKFSGARNLREWGGGKGEPAMKVRVETQRLTEQCKEPARRGGGGEGGQVTRVRVESLHRLSSARNLQGHIRGAEGRNIQV